MSVESLDKSLTQIIEDYKEAAGTACDYCDEYNTDAFGQSNKAIEKALLAFKDTIILFLKQQQ